MPKIMWQPSEIDIDNSQMMQFLIQTNNKYHLDLSNYVDLHRWSIKNKDKFWQHLSEFTAVKFSKVANQIFVPGRTIEQAKWFQGAKLNFAENLLSRRDEKTALIFNNENNQRRAYSYAELYSAVAKLAHYFRRIGVVKNDRVAAILPNMPETVISMLATTSMGAIWSSCSPDFGEDALYDRFNQIQPKILITVDGYFYNGKIFSNEKKIKYLQEKIPSLQEIILVNYTGEVFSIESENFDTIQSSAHQELEFEQLSFDHPIYIMYSSGTTGIPKCIVHGAGGTLLQHLKELVLHTDLSTKDAIFYYTTCGWMMWNWYISSLATGACVAQYEGSPFYPHPSRFFDFIAEEKITVFGTSAKYISALEKNDVQPKLTHDLSSLRTILSTGSPLVAKNYDYVYECIKSDLCLSSISGGTDILSCFALGNPILPVYQGELQCIGLGMSVKIYNDKGQSVVNEKGELVCEDAFPSMPIYFWNDPDDKKYHQAYFTKFPNVWSHGDYAELTDRGTMIIYGRSDTTLNPGGVRIGTAEIYRQVEKIPEIIDALAVSQEWQNDSRIILFVVLKKNLQLTQNLKDNIKKLIHDNCSPRHVPAKIIAVPDIPRTLSGKIVELAVREIIHGRTVKNISSIANPDCLEYFKNLEVLHT